MTAKQAKKLRRAVHDAKGESNGTTLLYHCDCGHLVVGILPDGYAFSWHDDKDEARKTLKNFCVMDESSSTAKSNSSTSLLGELLSLF